MARYKDAREVGARNQSPVGHTRRKIFVSRELFCDMMSSAKLLLCLAATLLVCLHQGSAAPAPKPQEDSPPMPYEYKYDVEDQEKTLYFGANESGDTQGKVIGGYRVLLPDGRLMTVEYTVEGESGFVPKITFEDNANPFSKG